jgi:hypothetical protein
MTTQPTVHTTPHAVAGRRRRALIAALGLVVAAAVLPAGAASAAPQAPEFETHFTNPGGNPQPPDPPDVPDWGPDDLANPTENPEPPLPPEDPDPAGDDSIPTPERVDAGFGGAAAGPHQAAGLALIAAAVMLALLFAVTVRRGRSGASR